MLTAAIVVCLRAQQPSEPAAVSASKPATADPASTDDRIAVYRAFLRSYNNGAPGPVNLGNRTTPIELPAMGHGECLKGIVLEDLGPQRTGGRHLDPEVAAGANVVLVDPKRQAAAIKANDPGNKIRRGEPVEDSVKSAFASGLLEVSEIVFDRDHRYAVLTFSFSCGALCGNGGTVVIEKADGQWRVTKRRCSSWIS